MFGKKKDHHKQYIIISQDDRGVRQRNLTRRRLYTFAAIAVVALASVFFASADALTRYLYNQKINKIKQHYSVLSSNLTDLQIRMNEMSTEMNTIEEKDNAIRTYADMPLIDKDIRQLGIGGVRLADKTQIDDNLTDRINTLEMDVQTLSRKVKLELASYSDIYNKVTEDVKMIHSIPSLRPMEG